MAAADVGIVAELAEKQRVHRRIRVSADAAVELYARLCKHRLSAAADAAADKSVNAVECQKARQRTVTAAVCADNSLADDFSVLNIIELELLRVAEVLKNLTVFIGNCDFHDRFSFIVVVGFACVSFV